MTETVHHTYKVGDKVLFADWMVYNAWYHVYTVERAGEKTLTIAIHPGGTGTPYGRRQRVDVRNVRPFDADRWAEIDRLQKERVKLEDKARALRNRAHAIAAGQVPVAKDETFTIEWPTA